MPAMFCVHQVQKSFFFWSILVPALVFNFCDSIRSLMVLIFVILIFMFPMMSDLEHLLTCLFFLMSLMNVQIFAHLKDMGFVFLLLNFESISCILNVSPLVDLYHFKIFSFSL